MKKITLALFALTLAFAAGVVNSAPINVKLLKDNQRSSSGTLSTLIWKSCPPPVPPAVNYAAPCIDPNNQWVIDNNLTTSTATWTWDSETGILASTGLFWATSFLGSNPAAGPVISDKVVDLVINTTAEETTASNYVCIEGTFLAGVNANGCGNYDLGPNAIDNSAPAVLYNVDVGAGPDPYCEQRTLVGDDVSTGNPRGVTDTFGLTFGCDDTDGAYLQYNVVPEATVTGGDLLLSDGDWALDCYTNPLQLPACAGATFLTFVFSATAVDDTANANAGTVPIAVLANDLYYSNPVTVTVSTAPTKGTVGVTGSPGAQAGITIDYTPNVGASGTDTFVYTAVSSDGSSDTATVTVTLLNSGANPDSATTTRNVPANINVGANDVGFTNPVTITITTPPDHGGSAVAPAPGAAASQVISYTPVSAPGTPGYTETFTYQITDGTLTGTAVVTVTVNNTVVVAGNGNVTISTAGTAPGTVTGTFNAGTAPNSVGNQPSVVTATPGATGSTSVVGNVVTYMPDATFFVGTDTYTYTSTDSDPGTPETATGTVTVTIPDVQPTLGDNSVVTTAGTAAAATALSTTLGNGSAAQNVRTVTTQAANGNCVLAAAGAGTTVTYTPTAGYTGSDSCVVTITDGNGDTDTGTLNVTVNSSSGGGGGGGGPQLPPAGGALDLWSLSLLGGATWLRRRRQLSLLSQRGRTAASDSAQA